MQINLGIMYLEVVEMCFCICNNGNSKEKLKALISFAWATLNSLFFSRTLYAKPKSEE